MNYLLAGLMRSRNLERPPGPRGLDALRIQLEFAEDQIGFFTRMKETYGDQVYFRLGTFETYQFNHPDDVEQVLVKKFRSFQKDAITHELDELLGKGLLTAEGDHWRRQRKLAAPNLQRKQIASYADDMVAFTRRWVEKKRDGEVIDIHHDMMQLTLRIVVKTLFAMDLEDDVGEIGETLDVAMEFFHIMAHTLWRFVPDAIPTPMKYRFRKAVEALDEVVYELIEDRRASGEEGDDLLWRLLMAVDDEGDQMTDLQLRDEVITMFLAGHETTALAISYAWHLLSGHPDVAERLFAEVDDVLGDRTATVEDYRSMPYLKAVVQETMRLYSPAWIVGREATEEVEIGGYSIPPGAQVLTAQSVIHRDERWFDDPDTFRPERWLDGLEKELPRYAYFPFGGGPRVCIGTHFAMMEAMLVVATMAQHFEMENVSEEPLRTQPSVTLRPATKMSMKLKRRGRQAG